MKVSLYCDPVRPSAGVAINGRPTESSDIFGFLYPVRSYQLQTWLRASGSWSGLERQLRELARGEEVELEFIGREADFEDLREALSGWEELRLTHRAADPEAMYERRLEALREQLGGILSKQVLMEKDEAGDLSLSMADLFPEEAGALERLLSAPPPEDWLLTVSSEEDFRRAVGGRGCCLLTEDFLTSYEVLERLPLLTQSLSRAGDMVWCRLESREKLEDFSYYAGQFPKLELRFVCGRDADWERRLYEKYGRALLLRARLERCREAEGILSACFAGGRELAAEAKALEEAAGSGRASFSEARRLRYCLHAHRWLSNRRPAFKKFSALLDGELFGPGGDQEESAGD